MQQTFAWVILIIAIVIILFIISRKFMILANVDVEKIQREKNALLKQQIIMSQLQRRFSHWGWFFLRVLKPFSRFLRNSFDWLYDTLNNWQKSQANREAMLGQAIDERIEVLLLEAEILVKDERYDSAEKKYIEIIGLDSKNFKAFRELGEVYLYKHLLKESIQTLEHALNLKKKIEDKETKEGEGDLDISQTRYLLATVYEEAGDLDKAVVNLKRALKIEESNPRYLDRLIEVSILKKDKVEAFNAYDKLQKANPENKKLAQFKEKISQL